MRVIGLGLAGKATGAEVAQALTAAGPADAVAVLQGRAAHPALAGVPLTALPESTLRGIATPTQSPRILARFGCGSVAEALAVAVSGGRITTTRQITGAVTWAIADSAATEGPPE
ncbi:hypothetical protein MASR1M32_30920 [Rhodobacter sp.]